jgi:hypothetical protein
MPLPILFNAKEVDSPKIFHFALKVDDLSFYCNFRDETFQSLFINAMESLMLIIY